MRLLEAELFNICQHRYQHMRFSRGLTGLLGPNGSGKSNALAAIYFAITGDISRFRLNKRDEVICQFAGADEEVGVRVVMQHHGVIATVERYIRPNKRKLVIGEESPIYGDKEITQKLEKWFGMPMKVIGQYVFVNQWEMFSLLQSGPAERAKDLYRLFGIDKAEECYDVVGDRINSLDSQAPAIDIDAARSRLIASRTKLRELEGRVMQINGTLPADYDPNKDPMKVIVEKWQTKRRLITDLERLEEDLKTLSVQQFDANTELALMDEKLAVHKALYEDALPAEERAKQQLALWTTYEQVKQRKDTIQKQLDNLAVERGALVMPVKPDNYIDDDEAFLKKYDLIKTRYQTAVDYLNLVGDCAACPTCGTPSEKYAAQKLEYERQRDEYGEQLKKWNQARSVSQRYRDNRMAYLRKKGGLDANISFLTEQLNSFELLEAPTEDKDSLQGRLAHMASLRKSLGDANAKRLTVHNQVTRRGGQIEAILAEMKLKKEQVELLPVSQDEYDTAVSAIDLGRRLWQERASLQSEISVAKRSISDDEVAIEEAAEALAKKETVDAWKGELAAVRAVVHRNALPKDIAQSHLEQLEDKMNAALSDLGVDFRVRSQDGLKFQAEFPDGRKVAAESLSGGEMVVFAIAWRLAVNTRFANDIGLLCLDEPTAGLDKDRLGCLRTALEKMRTMSSSRGLQCVIITHESNLMSLFDQVIELQAPALSREV